MPRAREVPAAALFRGLVADTRFRPRRGTLMALLAAGAAVAALALGTAYRPELAAWFVFGAVVAFSAFAAAGWAVRHLAQRWNRALIHGRHAWPRVQLALGPGRRRRPS